MPDVSPPSSVRIDVGWPNQPPVFAPLTLSDELRVPLSAHPTDASPGPLSGDLRPGEPLLDHPAEGSHMAVTPADGVVEEVVEVMLLDGRRVPAARVKVSETLTPPHASPAERDRAEIEPLLRDVQPRDLGLWIDRLRDAGAWADRWTSPDLLAQLNAALLRPIETIIVNLLDVDPTVPLNAALAANFPNQLLAGVGLLSRITGTARILAAVDGQTPWKWLARLRPKRSERASIFAGVKLVELANVYPQSDPSLLLYSLADKHLRPGRLPTDVGVILLDAAAAVMVGQRFLNDGSMLSVPLAVRDHVRRTSHFCTARVGTLLSHVLRRIGLPPAAQLVLRGGDVLRDIQITGDAVVGGTELIVHANHHEPPINPEACIRCGWCFEACPTRVQPANCLEAAQRGDTELAIRFGIDGCIDCGICSYVCPSQLPILSGIRELRKRM